MISKIEFNDHKDIVIEWWNKLEDLHRLKELKFKKGLNFIIGPNGCGKSSIFKLISKHLFTEGGNYSKLNLACKRNFKKDFFKEDCYYKGAKIFHDGRRIYHFDSNETAGLRQGYFDDAYYNDGVQNFFINKENSSGHKVLYRFFYMMQKLKENHNENWFSESDLNDPIYNFLLTPEISQGPITILLDEPTMCFDLKSEIEFFKQIKLLSKKFQIIVTTHSLFVLKIKDANFIELEPNYLDLIKQEFKNSLF